jgi:hypothetical protein
MTPAAEQAALQAIESFYTDKQDIVQVQFDQFRSIRPGPHSELKMALMERCIELLHERGIDVMVIEGVTYPATYALYDHERCRGLFLDWAHRMEAEYGVRFVPKEEYGDYGPLDFRDLTHLGKRGALRSTAFIMYTCGRLLVPGWEPPLPPKAEESDGEPPDQGAEDPRDAGQDGR